MSNNDTLKKCFIEALALRPDENIEDMKYSTHASWDSIGHMRLVAAIETAFGIMFTTDQILDMSCYAKACEIVKSHGVSLDA